MTLKSALFYDTAVWELILKSYHVNDCDKQRQLFLCLPKAKEENASKAWILNGYYNHGDWYFKNFARSDVWYL